jgi:hypothetical protein
MMTNIPDFNTKHKDCMEYLEIVREILWSQTVEEQS